MAETDEQSKFPGLKKLIDKFSGTTDLQREDQRTQRKALSKVSSQLGFTEKIIKANMGTFSELAQQNSSVAALIDRIEKRGDESSELQELVASGAELSASQSKKLIDNLEGTVGALTDVGAALDIPLNSLVDQFGGMLDDNRLDIDNRRDIFKQLIEFSEEQGVQSDALEQLKSINAETLNFTKEENQTINALLEEVKKDEALNRKVKFTIPQLQKSFSAAILTQQGLQEALETQTLEGKSLREQLLEQGLRASRSGFAKGIISAALASIGLGGLEDIITGGVVGAFFLKLKSIFGFFKEGGIGKTLTKVINAIKGVPKTLAKFGKGIGKVAKTAGRLAKVIPGIGTAITVVFAAIDGITGFFDAANISGKSEDLVTLGDKLQSSLSGIVSGLTFGFASVKDTFLAIDGVFTIFDFEFVTGKAKDVQTTWDKVAAGFSTFASLMSAGFLDPQDVFDSIQRVKDGLKADFNAVGEGITNVINSVGGFVTNLGTSIEAKFDALVAKVDIGGRIDRITESISSVFGPDGVVGSMADKVKSIGKDLLATFSPDAIKIKVKSAFDFLFGDKGVIGKIAGTIRNVGTEIVSSIKGLLDKLLNFDLVGELKTGISDFFKSKASGTIDAVTGAASDVGDKVTGAASSIGGFFGFGGDDKSTTATTVKGKATAEAGAIDTRAQEGGAEAANTTIAALTKITEALALLAQTQKAATPGRQGTSQTRSGTIDDTGLHVINNGLME